MQLQEKFNNTSVTFFGKFRTMTSCSSILPVNTEKSTVVSQTNLSSFLLLAQKYKKEIHRKKHLKYYTVLCLNTESL